MIERAIAEYKTERGVTTFHNLNPINEDEYSIISLQIETLRAFLLAQRYYGLLNYSIKLILSELEAINNHGRRSILQSYNTADYINKCLLDMLNLFYVYITHVEVFYKREFGKDSNELQGFINHRNNFYDNHFEYRFFYQLRNFSTHVGLPITNIVSEIIDENDPDMKTSEKVYMDREYLLNSYDGWKHSVRDKLKMLTAYIEVKPIVSEFLTCMQEFNKELVRLETNMIVPAIVELMRFMPKDNTGRRIIPCIVSFKEDDPNNVGYEFVFENVFISHQALIDAGFKGAVVYKNSQTYSLPLVRGYNSLAEELEKYNP